MFAKVDLDSDTIVSVAAHNKWYFDSESPLDKLALEPLDTKKDSQIRTLEFAQDRNLCEDQIEILKSSNRVQTLHKATFTALFLNLREYILAH